MVEWAGNPKRRLELNTFLLPKIYVIRLRPYNNIRKKKPNNMSKHVGNSGEEELPVNRKKFPAEAAASTFMRFTKPSQ